jgi:hypothetical protein
VQTSNPGFNSFYMEHGPIDLIVLQEEQVCRLLCSTTELSASTGEHSQYRCFLLVFIDEGCCTVKGAFVRAGYKR